MQQPILSLMEMVGAVMHDDHFVYVSGRHGSVYINKDRLYPHTMLASKVGQMLAQSVFGKPIDAVAGPALGGIVLSQWTAYHLTKLTKREVVGVYTEKTNGDEQHFTRGYDALVKGKNVLVVEDITNTGGSVAKVVECVKKAGGKVIQVVVMVNRDPVNVNSETVGAPFDALGVLPVETYEASECPLCQRGVPINKTVGHWKQFLAEKEEHHESNHSGYASAH